MNCIEAELGSGAYYAILTAAVGVIVRFTKRIPSLTANEIPIVAFLMGVLLDILGFLACGEQLTWHCLAGGIAGLAAAGGHEALMRSAQNLGAGKLAEVVLGKARAEQSSTKPPPTLFLFLVIASVGLGCNGTLRKEVVAAEVVALVGDTALTAIDIAYKEEQRRVITEAPDVEEAQRRLEHLDAKWLPVFVAYEALRAAHDDWATAIEHGGQRGEERLSEAVCKLWEACAGLVTLPPSPLPCWEVLP